MTNMNRLPRRQAKSRHLLRRALTLCLLVAAAGATLLPFRDALAATGPPAVPTTAGSAALELGGDSARDLIPGGCSSD